MNSLESVGHIVAKLDRIKQLVVRAKQLGALNDKVKACLPARLAQHTRLATVRDGCLVLQTDNAAWAADLRYKTPEILAALATAPEFASIRSIRVKNAIPTVALAVRFEKPFMSARSASEITAQAHGIDDQSLRAALLRLAERATK
jgi:hypothetical protein